MTTARHTIVGAAILAIAFGSPASASSLTADAILNQFNLVVFGNVATTSNMEGRAWIGGALTGTGEFHTRGGQSQVPASALSALYVGGSVGGGWPKVQNGGDAVIKGAVQAMEIRPGGTAYIEGAIGTVQGGGAVVSGPVTIPDFEAPLTAASAALSVLAGTSSPTLFNGQRWVFDADPVAGRTVYTVDAAAFSSWGELQVKLNGADTVVINVVGATASMNFNVVETPLSLAGNIIWNFPDVMALGVTRTLVGSVLAPKAHVTLGQVVEGTLVARSLQMGAQIHSQPWRGAFVPLITPFNEPLPPEGPPPGATVPVPAAAPLLVAALGALALLRRRRRA